MKPDEFLASYTDLTAWLRSRLLTEQNPEYLISLAAIYGELRCKNVDGVYHDDEVEQRVANRILDNLGLQGPVTAVAGRGTVLIASKLLDAGGHSPIVQSWLGFFQDEASHSLLITQTVTRGFEDSLKANGHTYRLCRSQGVGLVKEIIEYCEHAQRVVLHIHPDDIFSAIAAKYLARAGKQVIFLNHSDHLFSYGISSASAVCEVSSYGIALNRRTGRTGRSCYLGIPIDSAPPGRPGDADKSPGQPRIVLTCGAPHKYQPAAVFFGDFIDGLLLQQPSVIVELVGPSGIEPWWANHAERWGDRVRFLGVLPHDQYVRTMAGAAVYVDSFPVSGGTAFPEALLNGKQVAALKVPMQGYTPADELRVDTIEELAQRVTALLAGDPVAAKETEDARTKATEAHSLARFRSRVLEVYEGRSETCPWEHLVNSDTYWLERTWKSRTTLTPPIGAALFDLPISFCIVFLFKMYRAHQAPRYRYVAFALNRLTLRVLPAMIRNPLIRLRTGAIERAI